MARNNIKNKKHSESAKKLNWLKDHIQYVLIDIAICKKRLTADIDAKKRNEDVDEEYLEYNAKCLKRDKEIYNNYMKEIKLTKKMIFDASHYQE